MPFQIPDEILAMILRHSLVADDAVFSHSCAYSSSYSSMGSVPLRPPPDRVLVCKQWMRTGTRLVYHTVILRNRQQVDAFATTLKANPAFSWFVCKLRVDRGFGSTLAQILEITKGSLREACFCLDFPATDKPEVIGGMLEQLQLTRLVLVYGGASGRTITDSRPTIRHRWLGAKLAESMFAWPNLTSITLHSTMLSEHTGLWLGIIVSRTLHEVQVRVSDRGVGTMSLALARKAHAPRVLILGYSGFNPKLHPQEEKFYESLPAKARAKLAFKSVPSLGGNAWRGMPPPPSRAPRRRFFHMPNMRNRFQAKWSGFQFDDEY